MSLLFVACGETTTDPDNNGGGNNNNGGNNNIPLTPIKPSTPTDPRTPLQIAQSNATYFGIGTVTDIPNYIDRLQNPTSYGGLAWEDSGQEPGNTANAPAGAPQYAKHSPGERGVEPHIAVVGNTSTVHLFAYTSGGGRYLSLEIVYVNQTTGYTKIVKPFDDGDRSGSSWETKPAGLSADDITKLGDNYLIFINVLKLSAVNLKPDPGYKILNAVKN